MGIITRKTGPNAKGAKLTIDEVDNNFLELYSLANRPAGPVGPTGPAGSLPATFNYADFNDVTGSIPVHQQGRFYYANGAFNVYVSEPDVTLQVGEESWVRARNISGATITDGSVVYIDGAQGQRPTIELASNTTHDTSHVIGMATHTIENNTDGFVTVAGLVNGFNTSAYSDGDEIFLAAAPGTITNIKPTAPTHVVKLGIVVNATVNGSILFTLTQSTDINDITEVLITDPQDKDRLSYDSGLQAWINSAPQDLSYTSVTTNVTLTTSRRIFCNNSGPITITAPVAPVINTVYELIDANGNAGTHNITFNGNGKTINGNSTNVISTDYGKLQVVYNGTEYNII